MVKGHCRAVRDDVIGRTVLVETMDRIAMVSLEQIEDLEEEVMSFDAGLLVQRGQIARNGERTGIGAHGLGPESAAGRHTTR